jgi:molybdopterin-guanine dinucleotide biosynthesis protein
MPLAEMVDRFLWDADIVLAEGFKSAPEPTIEVFREGTGGEPLFGAKGNVAEGPIALVTDRGGMDVSIPVFDLGDPESIGKIADFLEERFQLDGSES